MSEKRKALIVGIGGQNGRYLIRSLVDKGYIIHGIVREEIMKKRALITGITGQDGSYLAGFLADKGYEVHGLHKHSSTDNTKRLSSHEHVHLHSGDLTDFGSICNILQTVAPDEIYNLGAISDVAVSFKQPEHTSNVNALGTLRILEAIKLLNLKSRFYQASTSELFGLVREMPQKETTPFYPRSPYGVSKLYAYWITVNYREAYGLFACNGILFNHESPLRGENFVSRKVTRALGRIVLGIQKDLQLGNINSMRDWGHAKDFVEMQWRMLQQDTPDDFVIATGEQHSVKEFVQLAAQTLGITIEWKGCGLEERGIVADLDSSRNYKISKGDAIIKINPKFFRPSEVCTLLGDPSKAYAKLGWKPKISFTELVNEMTMSDFMLAQQEARNYETSLC